MKMKLELPISYPNTEAEGAGGDKSWGSVWKSWELSVTRGC